MLNDDAEIILDCHDIHGARIDSDFSIQTNDGNDNSPVYFEFWLDREVCSCGY